MAHGRPHVRVSARVEGTDPSHAYAEQSASAGRIAKPARILPSADETADVTTTATAIPASSATTIAFAAKRSGAILPGCGRVWHLVLP